MDGLIWSDQTVMVTGASSGIGRSLALALARRGARVVAHGRSRESLAEIAERGGGDIECVVADLADTEGQKRVEDAIRSAQPTMLVLNAGFNVRKAYAAAWHDSEVGEMLQVNLTSPILSARTFAALPRRSEPRRLALVLSTSCLFPREQMSLYVAAKSGLMGFGKALQIEAQALGLRTTLFYPGRTDTPFRAVRNNRLMRADSVSQAIADILGLPADLVPHEFVCRPECDAQV